MCSVLPMDFEMPGVAQNFFFVFLRGGFEGLAEECLGQPSDGLFLRVEHVLVLNNSGTATFGRVF